MDKIFHVFVSSTYNDLKDERKKISEAIAKAGFVAEGMEIFPASSQKQMSFIEKVIDRCDYYILIVAGRYGSLSDDGTSYTEKEFRYAKSKKIPILAFIRENLDELPIKNSEVDSEKREKLERLRGHLKSDTLVDFWSNPDELSTKALAALSQARVSHEGVGWIRADKAASSDILNEINNLRKENDNLRKVVQGHELDIPLPEIPNHTDKILIDLAPNSSGRNYGGSDRSGSVARVECSWIDAFPMFFNNLDWHTSDWGDEYFYSIDEDKSCINIGSALASLASGLDTSNEFRLTKNSFYTLQSYFVEVGLMLPKGAEEPFTVGANKFARRQMITSASNMPEINVIEGAITLTPRTAYVDKNDEIPF